jgi:hypothetical protein
LCSPHTLFRPFGTNGYDQTGQLIAQFGSLVSGHYSKQRAKLLSYVRVSIPELRNGGGSRESVIIGEWLRGYELPVSLELTDGP